MRLISPKIFASVGLFLFLICVELYLRYVATIPFKKMIEATQIDKILHFIAGMFLATLVEWAIKPLSFWRMLAAIFVLSICWKIFEYFLDPSMLSYVERHFTVWSLDATGDIAATVLGGLCYWRAAVWKKV